jgi:hypothetical protein
MKLSSLRALSAALGALWLAGCAAPPAGKPRAMAIIMSGDFWAYSAQGIGSRIRVIDVDGQPVKEPQGPVELTPGRHSVNLACDGVASPQTVSVAAGEVYQFAARTKPGAKGCTGTLTRVRTANP